MLCGLLPFQVSEGSYGQLTLTVNQYPAWWHDTGLQKVVRKTWFGFQCFTSTFGWAYCQVRSLDRWGAATSILSSEVLRLNIIWIGGLAHFQKRTWDVGCMVWCHSAIWTKTDLRWFKSFCARHTWCRWIWLYAYIRVGWGTCCRIPRWMVMVLSLCLACVDVEILFSNKLKTVRVAVLKYHYAENNSQYLNFCMSSLGFDQCHIKTFHETLWENLTLEVLCESVFWYSTVSRDVKCHPVQKLCRVDFSGATWLERYGELVALVLWGFAAKDLGIGLVQLLSYSPCPDP